MNLLLDLGNTRLKAALGDATGAVRPLGEAAHRQRPMAEVLAEALAGLAPGSVVSVLCANVAGQLPGEALAAAVSHRERVPLVFLKASAAASGVRCAYAEPARLGADRWAALLGARGLGEGAWLVVDAGSALTIDALAPDGQHLGGWILPGLAMMLEALESRTGELAGLRRASVRGAGPFPADTAPAMEEGARLAAAGAVRRALELLAAQSSASARVALAGGDARELLDWLPGALHVPDLVFRGLARAAADATLT